MTDDKLRINLQIEGKTHPLYINRNDEEKYRKARLNLIAKIGQYKTRFFNAENLDTQDFLTMAAFHFSLDNLRLTEEKDIDAFTGKVSQLTAKIEKYLSEE